MLSFQGLFITFMLGLFIANVYHALKVWLDEYFYINPKDRYWN